MHTRTRRTGELDAGTFLGATGSAEAGSKAVRERQQKAVDAAWADIMPLLDAELVDTDAKQQSAPDSFMDVFRETQCLCKSDEDWVYYANTAVEARHVVKPAGIKIRSATELREGTG
mmetsp:Transcript_23415/g.63484  ORF Transcript_23415/g.63484 Transcript_23415/m.63484 type:complete len:117 (-) Transcript_23415:709-1059(-)